MRTSVIVLVVVASCSDPARRPSPTTPPTTTPPPVVAPAPQATTIKHTMLHGGRPTGNLVRTIAPDGTITTTGGYTNNGRGPKVETTQRYGADGTLVSYRATGTHELGAKFDEMFSRTGDVARWKSDNEAGERRVTGPAMYVPNSWSPDNVGFLVRAAIANGGTLETFPGGKARVEKVAEETVEVAGAKKRLELYTIRDLSLVPAYVWMDGGTWFGNVSVGPAIVPEGAESVVPALVAKQRSVEQAFTAGLATKHAHRPPAAGLAYTHARVLDVEKGRWLVDHTVVVVADKIAAVGPSKTTAVPAGAEVVDVAGKAVIPGLIDMHVHLSESQAILDIAAGVTTVRDVGNRIQYLADLKQRFDAGTSVGPHIVRVGTIEGRGPKAVAAEQTATTAEEARAAVELFVANKYDGVKIYNSMAPELVPVIAKLAREKGLPLTGHIPAFMLAEDAVNAGYNGIEHINQVMLNFVATRETDTRDLTRFTLVGETGMTVDLASKRVRDFFALLKKHGVVVTPTFAVFESKFFPQPTPGMRRAIDRLPIQNRRFIERDVFAIGEHADKYRASWQRMLEMAKALHDAKIHVAIGTDALGGVMLQRELAIFASAGFSNAQVLELATIGNARAMKLDKTIGSIAKGKRADLVVIDGDPLAKIEEVENVASTMRAGVVFPSTPLYEALGVKPR